MNLSVKTVSVLGLMENGILSLIKLGAGILTGSVAVLAEGIHSVMDVFSSIIAWWGIRKAETPPDEKHPFGHGKYENLASFMVTIVLFLGGIWIIFEAFRSLFGDQELAVFSYWNIGIMIFSLGINEIMARLKFKAGNENSVLTLVADGQHDRADVIASGAILLGLFISRWFPVADAILAILVGFYIIYESVGLARESVELLVDTADLELQGEIKDFLDKDGYKFEEVKTRRIGSTSFAEISLLCDAKAKIEEVDKVLKNLEKKLLTKFSSLSRVSLIVSSHEIKENIVKPQFWGEISRNRQKGLKKIGPKKKGKRLIVPFLNGNRKIISSDFGSEFYRIVDFEKGETLRNEIIKNPYYQKDNGGRGAKFAKSVGADLVIARGIHEGARENLKRQSIEIILLDNKDNLEDKIRKITQKGGVNYAK